MAESSIGYLFDENFSPKLVSVLRALGEKGLDTVVKKFGSGAKDEDWIPRAAEYGYIYVTLDRNQLADQRVARVLFESRARAVFLSERYSKTNRWDQALWLLKHWHKIRAATMNMSRGEVRFVQWDGKVMTRPPRHRKFAKRIQRPVVVPQQRAQLTLLE